MPTTFRSHWLQASIALGFCLIPSGSVGRDDSEYILEGSSLEGVYLTLSQKQLDGEHLCALSGLRGKRGRTPTFHLKYRQQD